MVGAYILATLGHIPGPTAGLVLLFCMNFSDNANTLIRKQVRGVWLVRVTRQTYVGHGLPMSFHFARSPPAPALL